MADYGLCNGGITGRFARGLSLDQMQLYKVATIALGIPSIGMALMASPVDAMLVLEASVVMIGLAQGAKGDIAAYLVVRRSRPAAS